MKQPINPRRGVSSGFDHITGVRGMTDHEALELLRLLHKYVEAYGEGEDLPISELAGDLAMSMDVTTDEADNLRREIEAAIS